MSVSDPQSFNLYGYVQNDPGNFQLEDENGHLKKLVAELSLD